MRKVLVIITIALVFFSDTECASLSGAAQLNKPAMKIQMAVMGDWLGRVHSLFVQRSNMTKPRARALTLKHTCQPLPSVFLSDLADFP